VDALTPYRADLLKRLGPVRRPLKIVVDSGNGCGGLALPTLQAMGATVIPLYCDADGDFPNHHPDPTVEENLKELQELVLAEGADFGVAFDGDVDRIGVVDERGGVIRGDMLTAIYARELLARRPGAVVIGEVKCSKLLYKAIADAGGQPVMWKAGHSLIKAKMRETGAALAGEMSGHIFFADGYYGFDDAIYAAGRLLNIVADSDEPLSAQLAGLDSTFTSPEIRRDCTSDEQKFALVDAATAYFSAAGHEVNTTDGVRVELGDAWGLIRASNTQPLLVLRFEADSSARLTEVEAWFDQVLSRLKGDLAPHLRP